MNRGQLLCGLCVLPQAELDGPVSPDCFLLWEWEGTRRPLNVATNTEHDELRAYLLWAGLSVVQVDAAVGVTPHGLHRRWVALRLANWLLGRQTRRAA